MRILIQTGYDAEQVVDGQYDIVKGLVEYDLMDNISVFSPTIFLTEKDITEGNVFARLFSVVLAINSTDEETIPWTSAKHQLYIGMAPKNVKFDEVISFNENLMSTQEAYIKYLLEENYENVFLKTTYSSADAELNFNNQEDLLEYLILRLGKSVQA